MSVPDAAVTVSQTMLARHRSTDPNYRADVAMLAEALALGLDESAVKAALGSIACSPDMPALRVLCRDHIGRARQAKNAAFKRQTARRRSAARI